MRTWDRGQPTNFKELFDFYHLYVKLLYSEIQTHNTLPVETLFELNAAFDHLARHWIYNESEAEVVREAFSHLKRSCLDIFKMKVREARSHYNTLSQIDTSTIDNGEYDRQLHRLFNDIQLEATEARRLENEPDSTESVPAFERWETVFVNCIKLDKEYFHHPKLNWAKKKGIIRFIRQNFWGFVIGVISSLVATWFWLALTGSK